MVALKLLLLLHIDEQNSEHKLRRGLYCSKCEMRYVHRPLIMELMLCVMLDSLSDSVRVMWLFDLDMNRSSGSSLSLHLIWDSFGIAASFGNWGGIKSILL